MEHGSKKTVFESDISSMGIKICMNFLSKRHVYIHFFLFVFQSNVNMGEAQRRAAHEAKQQRMDMAFEKVLYTTAPPRTVIHGGTNCI